MNINKAIHNLVEYAIREELITRDDEVYAINRLLYLLQMDDYDAPKETENMNIEALLKPFIDYAVMHQLIDDTPASHDQFDSEVMGVFMAPPSFLKDRFMKWYQVSPQFATNQFYHQSIASNYVRMNRIRRNVHYQSDSEYGMIDITINLSKPEKDPRDIEKQKHFEMHYPKCLICRENEGYHGNHAIDGRSNHRMIPLTLHGHPWYLQYSPYGYYQAHCIILKKEHTPMQINRDTFLNMVDFVRQFPHYFIGSNADLPIVGGSILGHDHYQGGNYRFAMENASVLTEYNTFSDRHVKLSHLHWPLTVLRLSSHDPNALVDCCNQVLQAWRNYSDEAVQIISQSDGIPHNTITPIARRRGYAYEIDLVLRNNRTTTKHPFGIFHPHEEIHHIKKENIGLIEVMGLAVLPARLLQECDEIKHYLQHTGKKYPEHLLHHKDWVKEMQRQYSFPNDQIDTIINQEIADIFMKGLQHCAVFPNDSKSLHHLNTFVHSL